MEIKKGERYLCIQSVVMDNLSTDYIKGKVYTSEADGCITDEEGCVNHRWTGCKEDVYFEPYIGTGLIPVSLTHEQWEVVMRELEGRQRHLSNEYHDLLDRPNKYFSAGCTQEKYEEFVRTAKAKMESAVKLYKDVQIQVRDNKPIK